MTYYADGSPCDYFDHRFEDLPEESWAPSDCLVAIGWLDDLHAFAQGELDPEVRRRLAALFKWPWAPTHFFGFHYCNLCVRDAGGFIEDLLASGRYPPGYEPKGSLNLFLPGRTAVFVVPELIVHYIDVHAYLPPAEFSDEVRNCPPMGTDAYFAALRRVGSREFCRVVPRPRAWWRSWFRPRAG